MVSLANDFEKVKMDEPECLCVCVYVCLAVCLSVPCEKTNEEVAVKLDTVTAHVTRMHHVLIILILTFI